MHWSTSPVKLFGCSGLLLFLVRVIFPPADFAGAVQLHSYVRLFDFRIDLTGYGIFEFCALVFVLSALAYYLMQRLTKSPPNDALVQLHYWPSLFFALSSVFLAHWVNRIPPAEFNDAALQSSLNKWLTASTWAFVFFLLFQIVFAIGAVRRIWQNRNVLTQP
jgi:hypothetical protein